MFYYFLLISFAVIDDENPTLYTAGATVTVTVSLIRRNLGNVMISDDADESEINGLNEDEEEEEKDEEDGKV